MNNFKVRLKAINTGDWIWPSKWKLTQSPQGVSPPSLLSGTFDKWTLKTTWASRQFLWESLDEGGDAQVLLVPGSCPLDETLGRCFYTAP